MYLEHSDSRFRLCPRLLWTVGRFGDVDETPAGVVARRRYRWPAVQVQIWMSSDRWFAGRDYRSAYSEYGEFRAYDVRVNGVSLERESELVHGDVLEIEGVEYRVVRESDDPIRVAGGNVTTWPRASMTPQGAIDAFANGEIGWIDSLVVLASHPRAWPRLREVLRVSADHADSGVRGAALRGLMALAASGSIEPATARRAIASVPPDADLVLRMGAARALAGLDALAAVPKLLAVLRESLEEGEAPAAAGECAATLARAGEPEAIAAAIRAAAVAAADAPARKRRALAARLLGELAKADAAALRPLRALVSDPHEAVRLAAARAAASAGAVDVLVDAVADSDERVRGEALAALRVLPEAGERILIAVDAAAKDSPRQHRLMDVLDRLTDLPA